MEELQIAPKPCKNDPQEIRVELCFAEPPEFGEALHNSILDALGKALASYGALESALLPALPGRYSAGLLFTPGLFVPGESGRPGLSLTFGEAPVPVDDPDTLTSLSQTWQWDEAEEVLPGAPHRVSLRSVGSLELPLAGRIGMVQRALYALTDLLQPEALLFPQSQCCVDPASYLENAPDSEDYFCVYGLVNARVFTSEDDGGQSVFMDTLGMHLLGLPDAQCLASDEETDFADLAYWLYNLAEYMRENPGSFEDGDVIVGLDDEEWELSYGPALIEPERCVLNVNTMQIDFEDLEGDD